MKNKVIDISAPKTAIEFFSGIGLARAGMAQAGVKTIWANDIDKTKWHAIPAAMGRGTPDLR